MTAAVRTTIVALAAIALTGIAQAQSDGPNSSGTVVNDGSIGTSPWVSTTQAQGTSDGVFAFAAVGIGAESNYLAATNFGFALDPTAIILGIEVAIQKQTGGGVLHDNAVRIIKGGVIGATDRSDVDPWPAPTPPATVYGGPTDLWGETWTAADINAGNFGAAISGKDSISGALAQVDSFAITVFFALCGDGITTSPTEQCDDSNAISGDCCSSTCQFESSGSPCPDTNLCNGTETCDGAGTCTPGTALNCDDGDLCTQDSCNPMTGCVSSGTPKGTCRTSQKAILLLKDSTDNTKDKLVWKWIKGQATSLADLGVPTGTTSYTLCIYAGTAQAYSIPNGPKWKPAGSKGFKYKDKTAMSDGVTKALVKSGAANKAKALVKGKGINLPDLLTVPITPPVTAQLVNDTNNVCYTTVFTMTNVKKNSNGKFKAKSP